MSLARAPLACGLAAALLLPAGCVERERPPNVLLIVVDTLRRDHLGLHGHERDTSPATDRLAADGAVVFDAAYATAPWTVPSVASMLTGRYPSGHGVQRLPQQLPPDAETLAERLSEAGWATAAVVSHVFLGTRFGFEQGFDTFLESESENAHSRISTPGVTRQATSLLRTLAGGDRPWFLLVHYFDPHYEYNRHPEIGWAAERAGRLDGTQDIHELRRIAPSMTSDELRLVVDLYDEEVRFTDGGIGRLLATLDELGLAGDTLVVLTADHGEEFMEHGWIGHTRTLYDELVRVPLIVRPPGGRPDGARTVSRPVTLVSLTPTVLELAGLDPRDPGFQAPSLATVIEADAEPEPQVPLLEVDFVPLRADNVVKETHKSGISTGRFKLVRDERSGRRELYDLEQDPGELHDLAEERPDRVAALEALLERQLARARADGTVEAVETELTEEELGLLRSLGYVGR